MASPKRCQILSLWNSAIKADLQDSRWQREYPHANITSYYSPLSCFFLVRSTRAPRQVCSRIAVTAEKRLGPSAAAFLRTAPPIAFVDGFVSLGLCWLCADTIELTSIDQLTLSQSVCRGSARVAASGIQSKKSPAQHDFNAQLGSMHQTVKMAKQC